METYSDSVRAEGRLTESQVRRILTSHSESFTEMNAEIKQDAGTWSAAKVLEWLGY